MHTFRVVINVTKENYATYTSAAKQTDTSGKADGRVRRQFSCRQDAIRNETAPQ